MLGPAPTFALFWHRHGNTLAGVDAVRAAAARGPATLAGRALAHGVELDLKWAGALLYAWHGPTGRERLGPARVRRWAAADRLALVDDAYLERARDLPLLVELKAGVGPVERALEALADLATRRPAGLWLAASSLDLLALARRAWPDAPRVLFASPAPGGRVWHRPTTYTLRSLTRRGLAPRLAPGAADLLCPLGLRPRPASAHARLAEAARARGLAYLPGRVAARDALEALAADARLPGAFVYAEAGDWPG
ncbi:MAG: hypothetical protein M9894_11330 [Planctomycetes bacterium]|nr:hypothetical protein [Planctomycetota bacterium]